MDPNIWDGESTMLSYIFPTNNYGSDIQNLKGNITSLSATIAAGQSKIESTLQKQNDMNTIVTNEKTRLQSKEQSINNASSGIKRMTNINYNYQKRYWDYTKIVIIWTCVLALYLILNLLVKYFPVIPIALIDFLILISIITGFLYSFWIYNNLLHYDPSYYGKISPEPPKKPGDGTLSNADIAAGGGLTSTTVADATSCNGPSCCAYNGIYDINGNLVAGSNTFWSYATNQCVAACPTGTNPGDGGICVSGTHGFSTMVINGLYNQPSADSPSEFTEYSRYK